MSRLTDPNKTVHCAIHGRSSVSGTIMASREQVALWQLRNYSSKDNCVTMRDKEWIDTITWHNMSLLQWPIYCNGYLSGKNITFHYMQPSVLLRLLNHNVYVQCFAIIIMITMEYGCITKSDIKSNSIIESNGRLWLSYFSTRNAGFNTRNYLAVTHSFPAYWSTDHITFESQWSMHFMTLHDRLNINKYYST